MSIYMSRLFPKSNSSVFLSTGNALRADILRSREGTFLVNAGIGSPRICTQDELTEVPSNETTRFENKVGLGAVPKGGLQMRTNLLERFFVDLVAGEPTRKQQAASRVSDLMGSADVLPGEPLILLPRRFRRDRAWMELNRKWRANKRVRGFVIERIRAGYLVAVGGVITFLPYRPYPYIRARLLSDRFTIESINPKGKRITVF